MDYEHSPNPGPGLWVGAGVLVVIGGAALLWVELISGGGHRILVAMAVGAIVAGLASFTWGLRQAWGRRDRG